MLYTARVNRRKEAEEGLGVCLGCGRGGCLTKLPSPCQTKVEESLEVSQGDLLPFQSQSAAMNGGQKISFKPQMYSQGRTWEKTKYCVIMSRYQCQRADRSMKSWK